MRGRDGIAGGRRLGRVRLRRVLLGAGVQHGLPEPIHPPDDPGGQRHLELGVADGPAEGRAQRGHHRPVQPDVQRPVGPPVPFRIVPARLRRDERPPGPQPDLLPHRPGRRLRLFQAVPLSRFQGRLLRDDLQPERGLPSARVRGPGPVFHRGVFGLPSQERPSPAHGLCQLQAGA